MLCCLTGSLLITAVEAALRIPQQLPTSKPLRARFISFLHRMVGVLPAFACAVQICSTLCTPWETLGRRNAWYSLACSCIILHVLMTKCHAAKKCISIVKCMHPISIPAGPVIPHHSLVHAFIKHKSSLRVRCKQV